MHVAEVPQALATTTIISVIVTSAIPCACLNKSVAHTIGSWGVKKLGEKDAREALIMGKLKIEGTWDK